MLTSSAKNKGRELESFIVQSLRDSGLDPRASRNPGSGSGNQKGDVWNGLGLTIECKNTKKCPGKQEFEQLAREAMGYGTEVLGWHAPNTSFDDSRVIMNWNDFVEMQKRARVPREIKQRTNSQIKFKLLQLKRFAQEVLKELE